MKTENMKVLLYLKKIGLDKLGKAPIMGRITLGRSIAQFSCKLSCNPDLWNPRESRMDGKSREAVEINGRLENLLLSIQSDYLSLIAKGQPFDATDVKELFQGSVQAHRKIGYAHQGERKPYRYRHQGSTLVQEIHLSRTATPYTCEGADIPIWKWQYQLICFSLSPILSYYITTRKDNTVKEKGLVL